MREALQGLSRYIVTPTVAKHRLFAWLDARVCPDHQLIVTAREDDTTFGILHSRFHQVWSLRMGTSLEDRPRYTPTTTFETFPFPEGTLTGCAHHRLPHGPARPSYRFGGPAARRTPRPLAQPARVGGVGRGTRYRLSPAPGAV